MGYANRLLAACVTANATGVGTLAELDPRLQSKITFTGNPVRQEVIAAAAAPYAAPEEKTANCGCWCSAAARVRV